MLAITTAHVSHHQSPGGGTDMVKMNCVTVKDEFSYMTFESINSRKGILSNLF